MDSKIPGWLRSKLLHVAASAVAVGAVGGGAYVVGDREGARRVKVSDVEAGLVHVPASVALAMVIGAEREGMRHWPYLDTGGVLTVCRGVTNASMPRGERIERGRRYSDAECRRLELYAYMVALEGAQKVFARGWREWDAWTQAAVIDMTYNLGAGALAGSTMARRAAQGDFIAMCNEMRRWVNGRVGGRLVRLPGLVVRRDYTQEMCLRWGADDVGLGRVRGVAAGVGAGVDVPGDAVAPLVVH